MPGAQGKILVIRGGAIGDFICTVPVVRALREHFPQAGLEVLGYPSIAQLALASRIVDHVQSIEARALASFFARAGSLPSALGDYFASFGLIVSYLYDPDEIFRTNVGRCSPAQFIVGPHRPSEDEAIHATDVFLKPLERLAIFDADPVPQLNFDPVVEPTYDPASSPVTELTRRMARRATPQLALHPGSGSERKNWPEEHWAELIRQLGTLPELELLLVGGEAEGGRLDRLAKAAPGLTVRVAQNQPLAELGRVLQSCVAFVGHDSGISHLAAAVGLPVTVLWGKSNARVWRPRGDQVRLLQAPDQFDDLKVETVFDAIREMLSSSG